MLSKLSSSKILNMNKKTIPNYILLKRNIGLVSQVLIEKLQNNKLLNEWTMKAYNLYKLIYYLYVYNYI